MNFVEAILAYTASALVWSAFVIHVSAAVGASAHSLLVNGLIHFFLWPICMWIALWTFIGRKVGKKLGTLPRSQW